MDGLAQIQAQLLRLISFYLKHVPCRMLLIIFEVRVRAMVSGRLDVGLICSDVMSGIYPDDINCEFHIFHPKGILPIVAEIKQHPPIRLYAWPAGQTLDFGSVVVGDFDIQTMIINRHDAVFAVRPTGGIYNLYGFLSRLWFRLFATAGQ